MTQPAHALTPFPSTTERKTVIYVSGPMTTGQLTKNIHHGCHFGTLLMRAGYLPILPHVNVLWEMIQPATDTEWLAQDFEHIRYCDAVLRIPGASIGGDLEVEWAGRLCIPVYFDVETLKLHERPTRPAFVGYGESYLPPAEVVL